jgi:hypothetical protein
VRGWVLPVIMYEYGQEALFAGSWSAGLCAWLTFSCGLASSVAVVAAVVVVVEIVVGADRISIGPPRVRASTLLAMLAVPVLVPMLVLVLVLVLVLLWIYSSMPTHLSQLGAYVCPRVL